MKNKNKTIVEGKNGSLSKKIGRLAVIVVLYIAIVSTLAFIMSTITLIVNADSTHGQVVYSNPYTYSSMIIDTDEGSYLVGSNDYFSTYGNDNNISFDDYYVVAEESEEPETLTFTINDPYVTTFTFPLTTDDGVTFYELNNLYDITNTAYISVFNSTAYVYLTLSGGAQYLVQAYGGGNLPTGQTIVYPNSSYFWLQGGSNDSGGIEEPGAGDEYWRPTDGPSAYFLNSRAVADTPITIKRTSYATYNEDNRNYSVFSEITSKNIIGFRFNFTKDIAVTYSQLSNNLFYYNYSMTNDYSITKSYKLLYYDTDGNLKSQEITSVISYDASDVGTLLPTLNEIELNIGEDNIGLQDIFLVQDLYVTTNSAIVSDIDYVHMFEWLAYYPTTTEQITNDYVNNFYKSTKIDLGEILLNSVNSFLGFELIPGFSLLSLLALVIGIPLLIYILKLFLGG